MKSINEGRGDVARVAFQFQTQNRRAEVDKRVLTDLIETRPTRLA